MTEFAQPVKRLSALAQLVQLYAECRGVKTTKELAELTGYTDRAIRKAKAELEFRCGTIVPSNPEPECRNGTGVPSSEPEFRPSHAPAHTRIESPSGIVIPLNTTPTPSQPKPKRKTKQGDLLGGVDGVGDDCPVEQIKSIWNAFATRHRDYGVPVVRKISLDRRPKVTALLDTYSLGEFQEVLDGLTPENEDDAWLFGLGDRDWVCDFDYFLRSDKFEKLHNRVFRRKNSCNGQPNGVMPKNVMSAEEADKYVEALIARDQQANGTMQ